MRFTSSSLVKDWNASAVLPRVHGPASTKVELLPRAYFTGNICPQKLWTLTETSSLAKIIGKSTANGTSRGDNSWSKNKPMS